MSLKSRRKFGFINGTIKKQPDKFYHEHWKVVHCTLIQWIRNNINPSLLDTISYVEDASVLWSELEAQFPVVDGSKIHGLKTQLHNYKKIKVVAFATLSTRPSLDWCALRDKEHGERRQLFYSHCDTHGHEVHNYYIKTQKFPEWWDDRPRTLADLRRARTMSSCGTGSDSGSSMSVAGCAHAETAVHANVVTIGVSAHSLYDSDRLSGMCNWILDTRNSNHVTGNLSCLEIGVRFLPVLLDRSLRTTIGVGELQDGRYWIDAGAQPLVVNKVTDMGSLDFWHRRLGHPSEKVVKTIPFIRSLNCNKELGWKLFDLETGFYFVSCDVVFHESSFPFAPTDHPSPSVSTAPSTSLDEPFSGASDTFDTGSVSEEGPTGDANDTGGEAVGERPTAVTAGVEPPYFKEAIRDNGWCGAMKDKIDALECNGTWEFTELSPDKKALGCRWVYKITYKSYGTIESLNARLVIFGNHQMEGLDYGEMFAPVVKMVTIRTFFVVAAIQKWELHQMDVYNAFLHGDLMRKCT
ncbi:uncharacterized protein LOC141613370 [Silene latifolia]|uniref:uncharacterized protein LOC141613370 n=1 Tax=Silene latifolia TaxID=37657 RepID=UPI003D76AFAF